MYTRKRYDDQIITIEGRGGAGMTLTKEGAVTVESTISQGK